MSSPDHARIAATPLDEKTTVTELVARYRAGAALLRDSIADLTPGQLLARPLPGKMSAHEVVCHVADCDQFLADRMKRTIAMDRPLLMGADGWLYPEALRYAERDLTLDLALVDATRAQMAADLDRVTPDAWERSAVHTETGLITLRELLVHTVRHLEHHVRTIQEKRAALGAERETP